VFRPAQAPLFSHRAPGTRGCLLAESRAPLARVRESGMMHTVERGMHISSMQAVQKGMHTVESSIQTALSGMHARKMARMRQKVACTH